MQEIPLLSEAVLDDNKKISRFKYLDGEIVHTFVKKLNFTPNYLTSPFNKTGFELDNGTVINAVQAVENEFVDLIGNHYITLDRNTTNTIYLKTLVFSRYYFMISSPEIRKSVLLAMSATVDYPTKFLVSSLFLIFPLFLCILSNFKFEMPGSRKTSFKDSCFDVLCIIFSVNSKIFSNSTSLRVFLAIVFFYGLLQHTFIQSTIIKNFNRNLNFGQIKKLDQLVDENYNIFLQNQTKPIFRNFGGSKFANKLKEISNRVDTRTNEVPIDNKDAVFYGEMKAKYFITRNYDNDTKESLFTIVPEPFEFGESFMAPRKSPYQLQFNEIIQRIIDAGITNHQISLGKFGIQIQMIRRAKRGDLPIEGNKPIVFSDITVNLKLHFIFIMLSLMTFLLELLTYRLKQYFM